jgi:hypothetical protein
MDSTRRLRVERRSARALIANYIHELSERHNGAERPEASTDLGPSDRLKETACARMLGVDPGWRARV